MNGVEFIRGGCGYYTYEVESYRAFITEVVPEFIDVRLPYGVGGRDEPQEFVWRGMRDPSWLLQPSLSRAASRELTSTREQWRKDVAELTTRHLLDFMTQLRGLGLLTRYHDELYSALKKELGRYYLSFNTVLSKLAPAQRNLIHELFSLGQHHELYTPFLDWTSVPLIALHFAFTEQDDRSDGVGHRAVFALNKTEIEKICPPDQEIEHESLRFVDSMAHDNPRIIGQAGLFTVTPAHLPIDQWVVSLCGNAPRANRPVLIRFLIRNIDRKRCLDELAALNIQWRTVYPDRFGAAKHTNFRLESFKELLSTRIL